MFKFGTRSLQNLNECDYRLMAIALEALKLSPYDIGIICGARTKEEQKELVREGKSQTLNSKHLPNSKGLSEAFDFVVYVNGKITWDTQYYRPVVQAIFTAASKTSTPIRSGGLWRTFEDWGHVELDNES